MANNTIVVDCSSLGVRDDFKAYISLLLTGGGEVNGTLLQQCKGQVCTALWGEGNPDVSGVGVRSSSREGGMPVVGTDENADAHSESSAVSLISTPSTSSEEGDGKKEKKDKEKALNKELR